ncbi:MAG TPA: YbhB/YbcL family Raf kinase inhibitor-like protein [Stellaceae bacterium]
MAFVLNSPAFRDGDPIPARHTQDGENVSPPLEWRDPPPNTQSFVLIVEDPDAPQGTFRHWAVYDIPADFDALPEGTGEGLAQGVNGFGNARYDGPAPPEGHGRHTYHFRLVALGVPKLDVPPGARVEQIWQAAQAHKVGEAEMVGTCERPAPGAQQPPQQEPTGGAETQARQPAPAAGSVRPREHHEPTKGDPVIVAGDAGGPNDGRNLTTADIDHDQGKPEPNRLEQNAYAARKPGASGGGGDRQD